MYEHFCANCHALLSPAIVVCGKVMFSQVCVKNSVQEGTGVSAQRNAGIQPPSTTEYIQQVGRTHPIGMYSCYYRPQRSCGQGNIFTPVCHSVHRGGSASMHAGIPTPPDQVDPPGPGRPPLHREGDSSIWSTSGRYASYWNAFLFMLIFLNFVKCSIMEACLFLHIVINKNVNVALTDLSNASWGLQGCLV